MLNMEEIIEFAFKCSETQILNLYYEKNNIRWFSLRRLFIKDNIEDDIRHQRQC